jgi:hypothetical protein
MVGRNGDPLRGWTGLTVEKNGAFDAAGLVPGSYWLGLMPFRGRPTIAEIAVEVTDRDVNGVNVISMEPFAVSGHERIDEEPDAAVFGVHILLATIDSFLNQATINFSPKSDGSFLLTNLTCNLYAFSLNPPGDLYIKSMTLGGKPVNGTTLDLRSAPPGELDILLARGTGAIVGTAEGGAGMQAVLVADGETGARGVEIDGDGHFQFSFVPPGRWRLFAAPAFDAGLWQSAEFVKEIENRGVLVELEKKGAAQVQLKILSADELQSVIDKVKL